MLSGEPDDIGFAAHMGDTRARRRLTAPSNAALEKPKAMAANVRKAEPALTVAQAFVKGYSDPALPLLGVTATRNS